MPVPADGWNGAPPPCRWFIHLTGYLVPGTLRSEWRSRWRTRVRDWWVLVERGELVGRAAAEARYLWLEALSQALWLRFSKRRLRRWIRGPAFPMAAAAVILAITAVLSHGFWFTRTLLETARMMSHRLPQLPLDSRREDMLVGHAFPMAFAFLIGVALVVTEYRSLHCHGWRYGSFLAAKTAAILVVVPLLWIETGAAIRGCIARGGEPPLLAGLVFTLIFMAVFGLALWWTVIDQRRRCPVCLHLLGMPVSMGSWASVFEPAGAELVCESGHGSLSVAANEIGESDQWIRLDASWSDLFVSTAP